MADSLRRQKNTRMPKSVSPKTGAERTAKHRAGLAEKRFELSPPPHPDDRPAIKALAEKLARKRAKLAKQQAG